ncbi:alpha/beta hydrolase fold protein [Xylanimonas cellulosilytica DSM 15894]|uniref:Alpha/beta hydrolase fold protein n=1 Tax=Xylanimonas cellulosilytica (strain DSM 15894 / JCM 12276 / CECT 5975 / KCTC 9989 / LMG 20990 / NBRC 107835 / XIL07) TaxID=446471 RepID=D1BTT2_XYLCX|nr:alpha/beta hydrolase [Xylanimonas cellulosilytica]ACZ31061.1 alpha/beta hydrolase fold protein [Xylanimonas cellulosilytica DSM 15894]
MSSSATRPRRVVTVLVALCVALLGIVPLAASAVPSGADARRGHDGGSKPTVVLVHGAFADSSGWTEVTERLQNDGYPVLAFSNPLRGVGWDAEYLRAFLGTIDGPIVLVGHSYGGAVITNAATGNDQVKSLVYVAAYALDAGESVAQANTLGGGHTVVTDHLVLRPFPGAAEGDFDATIDPKWFPRLFAQDLPERLAKTMAVAQRPGALAALVTPSGEPAWKTIPSWYVVATQDRIIPPEAERAMAKRAGAKTVEIRSSHVVMMSHPSQVVNVIKAAAR